MKRASKNRWLRLIEARRNIKLLLVCFVYLVFFILLFYRARHGLGLFWDWAFPYYKDQLGNYFANSSMSWNHVNLGTPLAYSSDYYFKFVVSRITFMQPEHLLYGLLVVISGLGAMGVYLISRLKVPATVAFLMGLAAFVNPAIFYKLTAGHIDYLVSYSIFIWLVYFMVYTYEATLRKTVILGLMVAFIGVQIQFFIFAVLFISLYFLFNRNKIPWKYSPFLIVLPVVINLPWLINYMTGANNLTSTVSQASKVVSKSSSIAMYSDIFTFKFSQASLISQYFNNWTLLTYTALFSTVLISLILTRKRDKNDLIFLISLTLAIFCAAGSFDLIARGPLTVIGPLFREVGHFAPLVTLFVILSLVRIARHTVLTAIVSLLIIVGTTQTLLVYVRQLPYTNYSALRTKLQPFKDYTDSHDAQNYRVLAYPFFDPLALRSVHTSKDTFPLSNSGYDSLTLFSKANYVNNAVNTIDYPTSPQYLLFTNNYNLSVLSPLHVKYIVDYSNIYRSTYGHYVPKSNYTKDIEKMNNDPNFIVKVIAANPGKLKKVAAYIYEISDVSPMSQIAKNVVMAKGDIPNSRVNLFLGSTQIANEGFSNGTQFKGLGSLSNLFNEPPPNLPDPAYKTAIHTVLQGENFIFQKRDLKRIKYASDSKTFSINAAEGEILSVNGKPMVNKGTPDKLYSATFKDFNNPYLVVNRSHIIRIKPSTTGDLGTNEEVNNAQLFNSGANQILNPSFEDGPWQPAVIDCNAYDTSPKVYMSLSSDHSAGRQSLLLSAENHIACTHTTFKVRGGQNGLLTFDYKSTNGKIGGYHLTFNDRKKTVYEQQGLADGSGWQSYSRSTNIPTDATEAELYLYAYPSYSKNIQPINYDNVSFSTGEFINSLTIPKPSEFYSPSFATLQGRNDISVRSERISHNLVGNADFEAGPWQQKVIDCDKYDDHPIISQAVQLSTNNRGSSLKLSATKHNACTYTTLDINEPGNYILDFGYNSLNSKTAGFSLVFNDEKATTVGDQLPITDTSWHNFHKEFRLPPGATAAKLWLYAYESSGHADNTVTYDDIYIRPRVVLENAAYVFKKPTLNLGTPSSFKTKNIDSTLQLVSFQSARKKFIYKYSENYSGGWKLFLEPVRHTMHCDVFGGNSAPKILSYFKCPIVNSWLYETIFNMKHARLLSENSHITMDGFSNGWLIDPAYVKNNFSSEYWHANKDGSINFDMALYFQPQSYLSISLIASIIVLVSASLYLFSTSTLLRKPRYSSRTYKLNKGRSLDRPVKRARM